MDIAVIGDSPIPDRPSRDLIIYSRYLGINARYIPISRLSINIDGRSISVTIRDRDFEVQGIFLRSIGLLIDVEQLLRRITVLRVLESRGVVTINSLEGLLRSRNKLETTVVLSSRGLPVPHTVGTEDILHAYSVVREMGDVVIKPVQGSRGYGAVRLSDADVAFQIMKTLITYRKPIYIQKYVDKPNRDMRIMVIDNSVFGCMYRIAPQGQWKTNIAQGAVGKPCPELSREAEELAIKSVDALGLIYGGVDIGEGRDGYVIFEVNGSPDWQELAEVTGKNPAAALVKAMLMRLRR